VNEAFSTWYVPLKLSFNARKIVGKSCGPSESVRADLAIKRRKPGHKGIGFWLPNNDGLIFWNQVRQLRRCDCQFDITLS